MEKNEQFVFSRTLALTYTDIEEQLGRQLTESEKEILKSKDFTERMAQSFPYKQLARHLAFMLNGEVKDPFANLTLNPPPGKHVVTLSFLVDGKPEDASFKSSAIFPALSFYDGNDNALSYLPMQLCLHNGLESRFVRVAK